MHLYLVRIVDRADFNRTARRIICKSNRAALNWAIVNRDELAEAARARGDDMIDYDYEIVAITYLDN